MRIGKEALIITVAIIVALLTAKATKAGQASNSVTDIVNLDMGSANWLTTNLVFTTTNSWVADLTVIEAQDVRFSGEFSTNYTIFVEYKGATNIYIIREGEIIPKPTKGKE